MVHMNDQTQQLLDHRPDHFLSGLLPYQYHSKNLMELCPNICTWIIERVGHSEIYTNILITVLILAVLDIKNPERFLFLIGPSQTGKSTYLKLLVKLVPDNKSYVTTADSLTTPFGLQDRGWVSTRHSRIR